MRSSTIRAFTALALAAVMLACGRGADQEAAAADSTDVRDLTRAGMDSAALPQLKDVPVATSDPATKTPRPKAAPPPPAQKQAPPVTEPPVPVPAARPTTGVIAAGTTMLLNSASKVCTNTNKVGDRFNGTLTAAVAGSNDAVLPTGATVTIELTQLTRSENKDQQIVMGFRVVSITSGGTTYTPDAEVVTAEIDRVPSQSKGEAAKKVVGGAAAGAIVGQILGRDRKGTLIGAAVGAAAGAAAAAASDDHEGCVNAGSAITVKLNGPMTVNAG
ncbi:MAG TPA: glycine zipper domain-containing protein [Gemmatimonadaceae bacterium]